jgi:hypothetical protein
LNAVRPAPWNKGRGLAPEPVDPVRVPWGAALDRVAALAEDQARRADAARDA